MSKKLLQKFNKYVGKEIKVTETNRVVSVGGKDYPLIEATLDKENSVLEDFKKEAKEAGMVLRPVVTGNMVTMDYRTDRINASISKSSDGKWKISNLDIG